MEYGKILLELENIENYFNEKEIVNTNSSSSITYSKTDLWTECLDGYTKEKEEVMAQVIGKISQADWREEEKLLWSCLLSARCQGSEQYVRELKNLLKGFQHQNILLKELIKDVGKILLNRELQARETDYVSEVSAINDRVQEARRRTDTAKINLKRHRENIDNNYQ